MFKKFFDHWLNIVLSTYQLSSKKWVHAKKNCFKSYDLIFYIVDTEPSSSNI